MTENLYKKPKTPASYLLKQVLNNREIGEWENLCGEKHFHAPWSCSWDLGVWSYARRLNLKDRHFYDFVANYRANTGAEPFGLDVGSSTGALKSLQIPGIAISIGEPRSIKRQEEDKTKGLYLVTGDILLPSTWEKSLQSQMKLAGVQNFQLIMAFPDGGLKYITDNPAIHFEILQQMWKVLDPNGGLLAVQMTLHDFALSSLPLIHQTGWIDFLNTVDGLEASVYGDPKNYRFGGIQLIRHPQAPDRLPLNFTLTEEDLKRHKRYTSISMRSNIDWLGSLKRHPE